MNERRPLVTGVVDTLTVAPCRFAPVLLGAIGSSAALGWPDGVPLPALVAFVTLTVHALVRRRVVAGVVVGRRGRAGRPLGSCRRDPLSARCGDHSPGTRNGVGRTRRAARRGTAEHGVRGRACGCRSGPPRSTRSTSAAAAPRWWPDRSESGLSALTLPSADRTMPRNTAPGGDRWPDGKTSSASGARATTSSSARWLRWCVAGKAWPRSRVTYPGVHIDPERSCFAVRRGARACAVRGAGRFGTTAVDRRVRAR